MGSSPKELFRRDEIWFVEKNQKNESNLYSLIEYKIDNSKVRKDASYNKDYLYGRYGAVPILKEFIRDLTLYRILIVCEGEKIEPGYFKTLKDLLKVKYRDLVDLKKVNLKEFIEIDGSGKNTESLVRHTLKLKAQASIPFGNVWCVFDKDSFTNE